MFPNHLARVYDCCLLSSFVNLGRMRDTRTGPWQLAISLLLLIPFASACSTTPEAPPTASPVSYQHIIRRHPNLSLHVVRINLNDPRVSLRVSRAGADPDGPGPWLTTLLPTSEIAERDHYDIAINGDFFITQDTRDIEGKKTGYLRGKPAAPLGAAMTDGQLWHRSATNRPYFEITGEKVALLGELGPSDPVDPGARQMIGGGQIILRDGKRVTSAAKSAGVRHPRTAIGLDETGTQLTFLIVDGRQPKLSIGMKLPELSAEMLRLGCDSALNLDGGGSTTLVFRNPLTRRLVVVNSPSDTRERAVADVLGVTVKAPLPEVQ